MPHGFYRFLVWLAFFILFVVVDFVSVFVVGFFCRFLLLLFLLELGRKWTDCY